MTNKRERNARDLIQDLRNELEQAADHEDPARQERLERLIENIDARLEGRIGDEHHQEIVDELREEAVEFEVEHPDVSATIRGFLNMLSSIGI